MPPRLSEDSRPAGGSDPEFEFVTRPRRIPWEGRSLLVAGLACGWAALGAAAGDWVRPHGGEVMPRSPMASMEPVPARRIRIVIEGGEPLPAPAIMAAVEPAPAPVAPTPAPPAPSRLVKVSDPEPIPEVEPKPKPAPKPKPKPAAAKPAPPKAAPVRVAKREKPEPKPEPAPARRAEPKGAAAKRVAKAEPPAPQPKPAKAKAATRLAQAEPLRRTPVPTATGKRPAKAAPAPAARPAPARVILIKATKAAPSLDLDALAKSLAPRAKATPPRPKAAEAPAKPAPAKAAAAPRKPDCTEAPSQAAALLCANPSLAAADRRLARAFDRAVAAGAPTGRLRRQQARWLAAREAAAEEAPWELDSIYAERIAELDDQARLARTDEER